MEGLYNTNKSHSNNECVFYFLFSYTSFLVPFSTLARVYLSRQGSVSTGNWTCQSLNWRHGWKGKMSFVIG